MAKTPRNNPDAKPPAGAVVTPSTSSPPASSHAIKIVSTHVDPFVVSAQAKNGEWLHFTLDEEAGVLPKSVGRRHVVQVRVERQSDLDHTEAAAGNFRFGGLARMGPKLPVVQSEAFGIGNWQNNPTTVTTLSQVFDFCVALNLACQRESTSYVIAGLVEHGIWIGPRDSRRVPEHKGAFMVAEPLSETVKVSSRDIVCMVGDDLLFLIEKAGAMLGIEA